MKQNIKRYDEILEEYGEEELRRVTESDREYIKENHPEMFRILDALNYDMFVLKQKGIKYDS